MGTGSTAAFAPMSEYRDTPDERSYYDPPAMNRFGDNASSRASATGMSADYDPYSAEAMRTTPMGQTHF
jgi:hypothetical protein